jgi:hypothetical protein
MPEDIAGRAEARGLLASDIKALNQSLFDSKDVADLLIREEIAIEIVHHLMNLDDDFPFGAGREFDRLNAGRDRRPLAGPVGAHSISSVDMAALGQLRARRRLGRGRLRLRHRCR